MSISNYVVGMVNMYSVKLNVDECSTILDRHVRALSMYPFLCTVSKIRPFLKNIMSIANSKIKRKSLKYLTDILLVL